MCVSEGWSKWPSVLGRLREAGVWTRTDSGLLLYSHVVATGELQVVLV